MSILNNSNVVKTLRIACVMFGLTCSPFLLNTTIRAHAEKFFFWKIQKNYLFLRDLYVDDTATSFNDLTKAGEFYHLTKSILISGGSNLRKWVTNNLLLRNTVSQEKSLNDIQNEKSGRINIRTIAVGF